MENNWLSKIYKETEKLWKQRPNQHGYAIFYSHVYMNPKLMIIGLNPGGHGSKDFDHDVAKTIPKDDYHDYFNEGNPKKDYNLAQQMRKLFSNRLTEELKKSIKLNLCFFRSPSEPDLKNAIDYRDYKAFSEGKVVEIIGEVKPNIILTEGLGVFDRLLDLLKMPKSEVLLKDGNYRILSKCANENITLIGMIHPSGSRTFRRFDSNIGIIRSKLEKLIITK